MPVGQFVSKTDVGMARIACLLALLLGLTACGEPDYQQLQGQTMGTYYSVQYAPSVSCRISSHEIDTVLARVNNAMSTYLPDSELSRFNSSHDRQWHQISPELEQVLDAAYQVWVASGHAFDVTVGPLVNLWGFGPADSSQVPSAEQQAVAASQVGMQYLRRQPGRIAKQIPELYLDLSALAKGYGVDQLAELLRTTGCTDFMVDIGGEMTVAGFNRHDEPWHIGIEVPDPQAFGMLQTVLELTDISIATSGDYRNFRVVDGHRVDHVLDPRTGQPADNPVVSVTVLHPSAMWADAYATTLMVLGPEEGMAFADAQGFPAYIMVRQSQPGEKSGIHTQDGAEQVLESRYNASMAAYLP